jgi:hypothetical protein
MFSRSRPTPARGDEHPPWSPALFSLDLLLPVIDLGHATAWHLQGVWQWLAAVLILLGWGLATAVAAGATRLLGRN